jgi:hypothetical protein
MVEEEEDNGPRPLSPDAPPPVGISRVLERKLKGVLQMRTDSPAVMESLLAVSAFFERQQQQELKEGDKEEVGMRQQQQQSLIWASLESQNAELSSTFLQGFGALMRQLHALEMSANSLDLGCRSIGDRLVAADTSTSQFLDRAKALKHQRQEVSRRAEQVASFLSAFQLSESEVEALQDAPLEEGEGGAFFQALRRVQQARKDCVELLGDHQQTAGFELLDALSRHQERAFDRLYQWVLARCEDLESDTPQADATLQAALMHLRERPAFHTHCKESVVSMRRSLLRKRFYQALASDLRGGLVDPARQLGDVLAWIHQAVAVERELLSSLVIAGEGELPELMEEMTRGILDPLSARLESIVGEAKEPVTLYRMANLLGFYANTLGGHIFRGQLEEAVAAKKGDALQRAGKALVVLGERLLASPPSYSPDLSPLRATHEAAQRAKDILAEHDASLSPADQEEATSVDSILQLIVEPLLKVLALSGRGLDAPDMAIFMLNNLLALQGELIVCPHAAVWVERITMEAETWLDSLIQCQADRFLERCGVLALLDRISDAPKGEPLSCQPGLDSATVSSVMTRFYSALFTLDLPEFQRMQNSRARRRARQQIATLIARAHGRIHAAVSVPTNAYENISSILAHAPEQVDIILQVND